MSYDSILAGLNALTDTELRANATKCSPQQFRELIVEQSLQIRAVRRSTRVSAIVIAGPDQGPASMGLAFDIGR